MAYNLESWSLQTGKIFRGILLASLAGIVYSIVDPIESWIGAADMLSSFGGGGGVGGSGILSFISYALMAGIIIGYVLILMGLGGFKEVLDGSDSAAVGRLRIGFILGIIAIGVDFIPLLGWAAGVLNIIAFVLLLLGYSALKSSATFPTQARSGASTLFVAAILMVVGEVLDYIPIIGDFISAVLSLVAFILVLVGWNKIKNTIPA
ncbi:MAG: hypothetical protein LBU62_08335 [Bacteroidales bacterium]|jgi:uncharacterized membrane protein|nr:hypothetical protein [Bacteroidales bacterium]